MKMNSKNYKMMMKKKKLLRKKRKQQTQTANTYQVIEGETDKSISVTENLDMQPKNEQRTHPKLMKKLQQRDRNVILRCKTLHTAHFINFKIIYDDKSFKMW
jgi:hypothetical protein